MIIAVDGTAASGKGTLARKLAAHYDLAHLDTGSLYRAVAAEVLASGHDPSDENAALIVAQNLDLAQIDESRIRTPEIGAAASIIAAIASVRAAIRHMQVVFANHPPGGRSGAVLDGRDIGTVICPNADVKLFIEAAPEVRARRRFLELQAKDPNTSLNEGNILADLKARDKRDRERASSPLKQAGDAHLLNTSNLSIEAAFEAACTIVDQKLGI